MDEPATTVDVPNARGVSPMRERAAAGFFSRPVAWNGIALFGVASDEARGLPVS